MPAPAINAQLKDMLCSVLNVKPDRLKIKRQKTAQINEVYHIASSQGDFILLLAPPRETPLLFNEKGMIRQLPYIHNLVRANTTIPVLNIVISDFETKWYSQDFVLLQKPSGTPFGRVNSFNHAQHNRVLHQMGSFLRQLHHIQAEKFGYNGPHQPFSALLNWQATFETMWRNLKDDLARYKLYAPAETDKMEKVWQTHKQHFFHEISTALLRLETWDEFVWVDDKGNVTGLYGFERAMWGDPEMDFAVLDYCGIYASSVWEGYGASRPNTPQSQIRRKFYLLYEIQRHILADSKNSPDEAGFSKQIALTMLNNLAQDL